MKSAEQVRDALIKAQSLVTRRRKALYEAEESVHKLMEDLHEATIRESVGAAVQPRCRGQLRQRHLDDMTGTLVEVRRTRAVVDFGPNEGIWTLPIKAVKLADDGVPQWELLSLG